MLGFVIITVNLDYAKLNPYYSIPTIICGEPTALCFARNPASARVMNNTFKVKE